jgi:hypothetical protein
MLRNPKRRKPDQIWQNLLGKAVAALPMMMMMDKIGVA